MSEFTSCSAVQTQEESQKLDRTSGEVRVEVGTFALCVMKPWWGFEHSTFLPAVS